MRAAPPVEVIAALRGGWWLGACGLWGACAGCVAAWFIWHLRVHGEGLLTDMSLLLPLLLMAVGILASAAAVLWHARGHPAQLSWDGSHWTCRPLTGRALTTGVAAPVGQEEPSAGQLEWMMDFGDAVLLRWRSPGTADCAGRTVWLPVSRRLQPAAWHGLRVALNLPTLAAGVPA